ncbi:MAG: pantetheine-phosphate adenylyltransferase [Bacteroidota bacterium]|nr:pantetheine-phosphate adenylyltransferase [Bacteroidota bacterium]MDP4234262.1 pantetheine-phosphate adenylyltransferase [Bacteroidota bacterium]MDP4243452.1 pantetheine-phosphate adenylyltransferase [Bacteroidota bacterium]MDP4289154.1 pantetheine-phosphate adenylyltransferase [Bacteroidota bacterium]
MKRIAIYPGTFDPITNGHLDIIRRSSELFDEVVVALARNSQKAPLFAETERRELIEAAVLECCTDRTNIRSDAFQGLLVEYARMTGATAVVRGLRAVSDFEYEFQMALMNRKLAPEITTVFLMPHEQYTYLNSTIIRELARYGKDVSDFVPKVVADALKKKFEVKYH